MVSFFRRRATAPADDWYERATPEERREYNAFGPWIYEVQHREDMPPRFLSWYTELQNSTFVLKIPINKDRRDARPGQDLYRAVVAVDAERLVFLTLGAPGCVDSLSVPLDEILGLRNFHVLLHGEFVFYLSDGTELALTYNGSSFPLVEKVMDFLSARISGDARGAPFSPRPTAVPVMDHYFQTMVREHGSRHPGCQVVFCEEPGTRYRERRARQKSLGLLILQTSTEWLFVDRGSAVADLSQSSYAGSTTWVPFSTSRGFGIQDADPLHPEAGKVFSVRLARRDLVFRLLGGPENLNPLGSLLQGLEPLRDPGGVDR